MKGFTITAATQPLEIKTFFCCLYGLPGVGKTSLSFTAPRDILHLNFDKGLHRAIQRVRPDSVEVDEWSGFFSYVMSNDFATYVKTNGIKSVVIDTVGKMLDESVTPFLIADDPKNANRNKGLTLPGYGAMKSVFSTLKTRLQTLGLNVVAVCHAKEVGEANSLRFEFAVTGGSSDILHSTADLIGFVSMKGDQRVLNFNPTEATIGKAIGKMPVFAVPDAESGEFDNFLASVFEGVSDNLKAQSASLIEFNERLEEWKTTIGSAKTPDEMTRVLAQIVALKDSPLLVASLRPVFGSRLQTLGFKLADDKKTVVEKEVENA